MVPLFSLILLLATVSSFVRYFAPEQVRLRRPLKVTGDHDIEDISKYADWVVGGFFFDILKHHVVQGAACTDAQSSGTLESFEEYEIQQLGNRIVDLVVPHLSEELKKADNEVFAKFFNVSPGFDLQIPSPESYSVKRVLLHFMINCALKDWIFQDDGLEAIQDLVGVEDDINPW